MFWKHSEPVHLVYSKSPQCFLIKFLMDNICLYRIMHLAWSNQSSQPFQMWELEWLLQGGLWKENTTPSCVITGSVLGLGLLIYIGHVGQICSKEFEYFKAVICPRIVWLKGRLLFYFALLVNIMLRYSMPFKLSQRCPMVLNGKMILILEVTLDSNGVGEYLK